MLSVFVVVFSYLVFWSFFLGGCVCVCVCLVGCTKYRDVFYGRKAPLVESNFNDLPTSCYKKVSYEFTLAMGNG